MRFKDVFNKILRGENLEITEAASIMNDIMSGELSNTQISGFLIALRMKGITAEEVAGFSSEMKNLSFPIEQFPDALDVVGTGGAKFKSFNISSLTSLILSSMGIKVAKHGNRSSTSKSGSADFLEGLGINLRIPPLKAAKMLETHNFTYLFAPFYHRSMKNVVEVRKDLQVRTVFNILGPLTNPIGVKYQLIGVYSSDLQELVINSLKHRGHKRVVVVYNENGADEILNHGKTRVMELDNDSINSFAVTPSDFGVKDVSLSEIKNLSVEKSVQKAMSVLGGKLTPIAEFAAVNGAMAMRVKGLGYDLEENTIRILDHLETGKALDHLKTIINASGGTISAQAKPFARQ